MPSNGPPPLVMKNGSLVCTLPPGSTIESGRPVYVDPKTHMLTTKGGTPIGLIMNASNPIAYSKFTSNKATVALYPNAMVPAEYGSSVPSTAAPPPAKPTMAEIMKNNKIFTGGNPVPTFTPPETVQDPYYVQGGKTYISSNWQPKAPEPTPPPEKKPMEHKERASRNISI